MGRCQCPACVVYGPVDWRPDWEREAEERARRVDRWLQLWGDNMSDDFALARWQGTRVKSSTQGDYDHLGAD